MSQGLGALASFMTGGLVALPVVPAATVLFSRLTRPLGGVSRLWRAGVVGAAAYGVASLVGLGVASLSEGELAGLVMLGTALAALPAQLAACSVLLLLPRWQRS